MMNRKLKIGLLVDSDNIPNWAYKMLEILNSSDYAEISLVIKNGSTSNNKKSKFRTIYELRKKLVWILYNKIDSKLFKVTPDAFKSKKVKELVSCDEIVVVPKQKKFSDYIIEDDIAEIKKYNLDILIRLGFRILRGDILKIARYGIWSYHHGDNTVNRGGPAGTWEVFENWDVTGVILQILSEDLDGGLKLSDSFSATEKLSVKRNKNKYYWKALNMMPRKLKELHTLGPDKFFNSLDKSEDLDFYSNRLFLTPTNLQVLKAMGVIAKRKINSLFYNSFYFNQWILLFKFNSKQEWSKSFFRFKKIVPPKDRFWADPFIVEKDNKYYLFIEELIYKEGLGKISVMELDQKGNYTKPKTIIENDYHMSYPFIIEEDGKLYLIPETAANNSVDIYECIEFPYKWSFKQTLMKGIHAVDSTILKHDNKYWLFCNVKENNGASSLDELFLFYSDSLLTDEWISHPKNPIVSDVRRSRPAGNIFRDEKNNLYRPSQDCAKRYGHSMKINKIEVLTTNDYSEKTVNSILPNWDKKLLACHSINKQSKLTIIDGLLKRRRF